MTDRRVVPFSTLAAEIGAGTPRLGAVRLVAIDGFGGAGKSVFAGRLSGALGGAPVVHTDAFATWDDQFDWWGRLERELLAPLADGRAARFRATDWSTGRDGPIVEVAPEPVVILEGVSSGRRAVIGPAHRPDLDREPIRTSVSGGASSVTARRSVTSGGSGWPRRTSILPPMEREIALASSSPALPRSTTIRRLPSCCSPSARSPLR